jgi:hypothetical protein
MPPVAQFRGDDCVFRRDVVSQQLGLSSGPDARSLDDVFETAGYAVQRAAWAVAHDLSFGRLGLPQGEIGS